MNPRNKTLKRRRLAARLAVRRLVARLLAAWLVISLMAAGTGMAEVAPTFHSSLRAASDAATADQSLVLLIFGAQWCGPCKLLKSKTLSSPEFMAQEYPLHVAEVDIDARPKMANEYAIEAVPTLVLLTADGKIVERQTGYMETADLMKWLQTGRQRAAAGQWEGTVPGAPLDEFIKKAAADNIGTNDIQQLVGLLGDPDPANREAAGKILLAQRENAMPALIAAVGNPYLGVRIGATGLLERLAPDLAPVDPWQSPLEMSNAVAALQKWWTETGRLPEAARPRPGTQSQANSIVGALEQLRGGDPARCTVAMTELVNHGQEALPAIRDAIRHAGRTGDQRTLGLLEDVRWTILVPESVEQQSGGIRAVLARGKSSERQAAAERLGRMGKDALGILIELAGDSDPLVVESTVRALSAIGGQESVSALAALLQSPDSNLRMTAAQALGHTKNAAAVKPLLAAAGDSDEVVACAALSGIEETKERDTYNRSQQDLPDDLRATLRQSMADPRWRVRATAAEVAGKLSAGNLADDLKKLLNDNDGFVVKSALTALGELNAAPSSPDLIALTRRLPSLQTDVVEMMLESETDDTIKTITDMFKSGSTDTRLAILNSFLRRGMSDNEQTDASWKPMFAQAVAAPDPRLRRVAVQVLNRRSTKLSAPVIGPLLGDEDRETRVAAASVALQILTDNSGGTFGRRAIFANFSSSFGKTNSPLVSPAEISRWHTNLLQRPDPSPDLSVAAAIFATGDGKTDMPMLLAGMSKTNASRDSSRKDQEQAELAISAIAPKLALPADLPILEKLSQSPVWFALAASESPHCTSEVSDYLMDPARFKSAVEPAGGADLEAALEQVAGFSYGSQETRWSFWTDNDHTKTLALSLLDSTNAAWRSAAVFALGRRSDAKDSLPVIENAVTDANPWVRISAVKAICRNDKDRQALDKDLGPLVADTNLLVASVAAVALLEPETRQAADMIGELDYFQFESVRGGRESNDNQSDQRPLTVLDGKPSYLEPARHWLSVTNGEAIEPLALLLAQFGDFSGVDRLAAQLTPGSERVSRSHSVLLAGIALSQDLKYLPVLKQLMAVHHDESSLRKFLQAMKGMSGPEARQLRLEINKKIRNLDGASAAGVE